MATYFIILPDLLLVSKKIQVPDHRKWNGGGKRIRKFAGDYRLQTGEKELVINTSFIDTESRTELTEKLEKLTAVVLIFNS